MKKVVLDSKRKTSIFCDFLEEDGEYYTAITGKKYIRIPFSKVLYIEEVVESNLTPMAITSGKKQNKEQRQNVVSGQNAPAPVLSASFQEAVKKNMSEDNVDADLYKSIDISVKGAVSAKFVISATAEEVASAETTPSIVNRLLSREDISAVLKDVRIVKFVKSGALIEIETKERDPVPQVNTPAAVTNLISSVGALMSPSPARKLSNLGSVNENTKE